MMILSRSRATFSHCSGKIRSNVDRLPLKRSALGLDAPAGRNVTLRKGWTDDGRNRRLGGSVMKSMVEEVTLQNG